jgi:hypothetical protein
MRRYQSDGSAMNTFSVTFDVIDSVAAPFRASVSVCSGGSNLCCMPLQGSASVTLALQNGPVIFTASRSGVPNFPFPSCNTATIDPTVMVLTPGRYVLSGSAFVSAHAEDTGGRPFDASFQVDLGPAVCYANCGSSTTPPVLNVNDLLCFQAKFAAGDSYANCDGSTEVPVLTVNDFICFQSRFAQGCP